MIAELRMMIEKHGSRRARRAPISIPTSAISNHPGARLRPGPSMIYETLNAWSAGCASRRRGRDGAAVIMVLAFIVLVTVVVVAFFTRAILDRQISSSSASQNRIELFAQGAVANIEADLKQEIVAGSTNAGTAGAPVYLPASPVNAVPCLAGSTGSNGLQNLLKVSGTFPSFSGTSYSSSPARFAPPRSPRPVRR